MRNPKVRRALSPLLRHLPRWVEGVEGVEGIENNKARQVLEAILLRLERLEAAESVGLLEAPSLWQRWRGAAQGALVALGLGLAGLLGVALSGASRQLESALQPLVGSQPLGILALAVFVLAALGGLLGWAVERWKR